MKKIHICVIGAGGTGTYFLKEFSRFAHRGIRAISNMSIVDGDIIEAKNLERQAFSQDDIGLNKAACMASVLSEAFELDWVAYNFYLTSLSQLESIFSGTEIPFIIGCVDNHACRLLLEEFFNKTDTIAYLDSANEYSTGEVVFSYKKDGKVISPLRSHYFPAIKTSDMRKRTEMSCEELNSVAPQHIATNMAAGNILLKETCSFLDDTHHPGMVLFDLDNFIQEYIPYTNQTV